MRFPFRSFFRPWIVVLIGALVFLAWGDAARLRRVDQVTDIAEWSVDAPAIDATSPTGYTGGQRRLMVPSHNSESYDWIAQTQQMFAHGEWRVRRVTYDNAPFGRETHAPSPYRWWLGLVAWSDHAISGRPLALAVEHAALWADPLLHALLLVGTAIFVARRFGALPAALLAAGIAALFPFAGAFLPGAPDHRSLALAFALWSVLPLLAGIGIPAHSVSERAARGWFFLAGVAGGLGIWISAASEVPVLAGLAAGALLATWLARHETAATLPWRSWALGGGLTTLAAYMLEYFPANMAWRPEVIHPLFAISWLGGGEVLAQTAAWSRRKNSPWIGKRRDLVLATLAALAMAATPVAMAWTANPGFLTPDPLVSRLTLLNGTVAPNLAAWIARDGLTAGLAATCLPWLLLGTAASALFRGRTAPSARTAVAVALGPAIVALGFACSELRWCNTLDAALLALAIALLAGAAASVRSRWWSAAAAIVFLAPGALQLAAPAGGAAERALNENDVEEVVGRDLAHWLANRAGAGGATVLASPELTTALCFHGGLRGVGTLAWENKDGLAGTLRIARATSQNEALTLLRQRGITHIVLPSWDSFLTDYAQLGSGAARGSFVAALARWAPPVWLRPLPYHLPQIAGFEGQSVAIFEVAEEQDEATATSLLAEYFVDMGRIDFAESLREKLRRFPANPGARIALAQVEAARGDATAFAAVFNPLLSSLAAGADRAWPWERRVSLAFVLAQGKRPDLARVQVERCLREADEPRLRALAVDALFRLLVLGKKFDLQISDPRLRALAGSLLPPDSRARL